MTDVKEYEALCEAGFADGPGAEAWGMMTCRDNPMPPGVALDWVRQTSGVEDVRLIKSHFYLWIGNALGKYGHHTGWHYWPEPEPVAGGLFRGTLTGAGCRALMAGRFDDAEHNVAWIEERRKESQDPDPFATAFLKCVGLCREIAAQPE